EEGFGYTLPVEGKQDRAALGGVIEAHIRGIVEDAVDARGLDLLDANPAAALHPVAKDLRQPEYEIRLPRLGHVGNRVRRRRAGEMDPCDMGRLAPIIRKRLQIDRCLALDIGDPIGARADDLLYGAVLRE